MYLSGKLAINKKEQTLQSLNIIISNWIKRNHDPRSRYLENKYNIIPNLFWRKRLR